MKRLYLWIVVLFLFSFPTFAQATPSETVDFTPLTTVIENELKTQNAPGLAVAVVYEGDVVYSEGFGVRNTETNDPVTSDTLFRIGSTTKPFTTIGVLMLVEDGKVDLDAPVSSYVPEFTVSDTITVRHLLSHTAGLSDYAEPYGRTDSQALSDYVASFSEEAVFTEPGVVFSYSNPGFDIAGRIIETVSGQTYSDYMAKEVFPALGLERTTLDTHVAMTYPLAVGYSQALFGLAPVRPVVDNAAEYPAGFIFSSVNELTHLAAFVLNDGVVDDNTIISAELAQTMQTTILNVGTVGYGLGLIISEYHGTVAVGHDGAINGYSSFFNTLPDYGLGVIVLASKDGFDAKPIFDAAADLLLDLPEETITPAPELTEDELGDYTGIYEMSDIFGKDVGSIKVSLKDGKLIGEVTGQPSLELRSAAVDTFDLYFGETNIKTQVVFVRDTSGEVAFISVGFRAAVRQQ